MLGISFFLMKLTKQVTVVLWFYFKLQCSQGTFISLLGTLKESLLSKEQQPVNSGNSRVDTCWVLIHDHYLNFEYLVYIR
jgi:hypothetical protein